MNKKNLLLSVLSLALFLFSGRGNQDSVPETVRIQFITDLGTMATDAADLRRQLELFSSGNADLLKVRAALVQAKNSYKRTEYLLAHMDHELAMNLNGAPLPKVSVDYGNYLTLGSIIPNVVTAPPEGLQVLEELLFQDALVNEDVRKTLSLSYRLEEKSALFANSHSTKMLTNRQILSAMREELVRVMTMGITGFDAPAHTSAVLENAATALLPLLANVELYADQAPAEVAISCKEAKRHLSHAIDFLRKNDDFENFDRAKFIREYADPAFAAITELHNLVLGIPEGENDLSRPMNQHAKGLFEPQFLQTAYYSKQDRHRSSPELVSLGRLLFFDPALSSNDSRSCASCHIPSKAFTDGRKRSLAFDFEGELTRNSPTLVNSAYASGFFWDNRASYLQDQVPDVLTNIQELHTSYREAVGKLSGSKEYRNIFKKAFPEENDIEINPNTINRAIAAYVQSLTQLNSPFDRYMRGELADLPKPALKGFNLFMGKAACATCHFAPIFNGTVPPDYDESEVEVLGVPSNGDLVNPMPDTDPGRAGHLPAESWQGAFKTPTLRNITLTAPYMHNGAFATLEEVVEFYDLGGGQGIGLAVPNQTLPSTPLGLDESERKDLVAFLESLTDTSTTYSAPESLPSFGRGSRLNNRKVGGKY